MGHEVRLMPPAYVKPFVERHKNDAADAEAIWDAPQRPNMRFVAIKSEEHHLTEYGWVALRGPSWATMLGELIDDDLGASLSPTASDMFRIMPGLVSLREPKACGRRRLNKLSPIIPHQAQGQGQQIPV